MYESLSTYREFYGDFEYPRGFPVAFNLGIKFYKTTIFLMNKTPVGHETHSMLS